jgi:multidrug efflux pump
VPELRNEAIDTFTVISVLVPAEGAAADPVLLSRLADELADRLRGLPGTKKVQVYGVADEEILVEIDPARLRSWARHG